MERRSAGSAMAKKLGLTGTGAALLVGGALLAGGSATASTAAPSKVQAQTRVTGGFVAVGRGANALASVQCPAGTVVTGGGGQTSAFKIFLTDSYRSGNGWVVRGTNTNSVTESIRAVAVCQQANSTL